MMGKGSYKFHDNQNLEYNPGFLADVDQLTCPLDMCQAVASLKDSRLTIDLLERQLCELFLQRLLTRFQFCWTLWKI